MDRRTFVRLAAAGAPAAALAEAVVSAQQARSPATSGIVAPTTSPKAKMKVGTQHGHTDDILRACAAFGVHNICSELPSRRMDEAWSVESLTTLRDRVASHGIALDMVPLPMSSSEIAEAEMPAIFLGKSPERDRNIDDICQIVRNCAGAGIPAVKYNFTIIGIPRSGTAAGRGGARYSEFVYARAKQDPPMTNAGRVDADTYWERITYFLERVVPIAEEYKVRLACHPQDPGVPKGSGWRGVDAVLGSPDGLKKFVSIKESPYHGLNFCQGTVSEQLEKPAEEIFDVIRYFGSRKKIFNVHFRNVEGGFLNFRETFIDNGSVDMLKAMRVYKEVGYDGMMMPDHVPRVEGVDSQQGFAFAFGYIKALIAAVAAEA
ncbi:MAG TPA: mannonate dehydratase [Vicinamibacterales bacterium]|nr:mannonate dehydratase [Vicinamibacterales bacterium]